MGFKHNNRRGGGDKTNNTKTKQSFSLLSLFPFFMNTNKNASITNRQKDGSFTGR